LALELGTFRRSATSFAPDVYCPPDHAWSFIGIRGTGRVIVRAFAEEFQ